MNTVLASLKTALSGVCTVVTEYPGTAVASPPLMAVGILSAETDSSPGYLGTVSGQEYYGLGLKVVFSLNIYASTAAGCRSIFGQVLEALRSRCSGGLKISKLSCEAESYDKDLYLYCLPCRLEADSFVYASEDQNGRFVDFDLRGVTLDE